MLLSVNNNPDNADLSEGDIIAITRYDEFIGYASIFCITKYTIILDVDKKVWKMFNAIIDEKLPLDFKLEI